MEKDIKTKNKNKLVTIGSSVRSNERQADDYYATEPKALEIWPKLKDFKNVWEPAVGGGHLANVLKAHNKLGKVSDLVDRGYPGTIVSNFLESTEVWDGDLITNPPYKMANVFIEKAHELTKEGALIAMFLPVRYLEGLGHYEVFKKYPPREIWVSVRRLTCAKNGDPNEFAKGSATAYAWFVWENGYNGNPEVFWFNQ